MPSRRAAKMASQVRNIVGEAITQRLSDPRISPLASITRVDVSGDLQIAKVYISVMGSEADERKTLRALDHATGFIQRLITKRIQARHCPEVRFLADQSVKGAMRTVQIIEESMQADGAGDDTAEDPDSDGGSE
ncbi:MAG: 30S ribosome-binding factor RbfA [bacterium]|nr:30S ribosome-binding factor RbfA [bacterium]